MATLIAVQIGRIESERRDLKTSAPHSRTLTQAAAASTDTSIGSGTEATGGVGVDGNRTSVN